MDSETMNPSRFEESDEVLGSEEPEGEQQFMGWEDKEEEEEEEEEEEDEEGGGGGGSSPTQSGGVGGAAGGGQAEEVSFDEKEAGVSQDGNVAGGEYSGGEGAAAGDTAAVQYPELSNAGEKEGGGVPEDNAFADGFEDGDGSPEEQLAFVNTLEKFFRDRSLEFKAPKFYGEELNCLKLWRAVMRLGGYEQVTSGKLWRQVGESFKPPKTCTTISWSFRGFYEKALLDYERFITGVTYHDDGGDPSTRAGDNHDGLAVIQPPGRARRDAAARAMQGWHTQRMSNGDLGDMYFKDKSSSKRDKRVTKPGFLKRKDAGKGKYSNFDDLSPAKKKSTGAKGKVSSTGLQSGLDLDVIDEGPQADWVKINVHQTRDCFEVYALVPGLLREEVRIQCEVGGRLVIAGEPEQPDNPWGVTAFRKVINLPLKIDAHQTSAVVTLHGQLFIRVPFAQSTDKGS